MRVLFTTVAAPTHLHTQVPLAWAMRASGHDVRMAAQPDVAADIAAAGLTAVLVGDPINAADWADVPRIDTSDENSNSIWDERGDVPWALLDLGERRPERLTYDYVHGVLSAWTALDFLRTSSPRMVADLVEFARDWRPDLVIWDPLAFAGGIAAMAVGAAHARLMFGLDVIAQARAAYLAAMAARPPALRDDPLAEWLGPVLAGYGCAFTEEAVVGQWTVDPVPPSVRLPVGGLRVPMRYVPYNGLAAVPRWLRTPPERRRVCLTLGRSFREILGGDRASVGELLDSVADLDVEVVATLTGEQLEGVRQVPGNVRLVDFVPLDVLLPGCAAIIHHGGSGTSQTALAHGVPQVIVPARMLDNQLKSERVAEAGAGLCAPDPDRITAAELRKMLERVLTEPSFAHNAARLAREMAAAPSPREIVPALERLAGAAESRGPREG
ncbi:activator-dependent family glycosyltransferase [Spirillospora sp. NBC_00431]